MFNPAPEVAIARDAAAALAKTAKSPVVMCIVTYVTREGQMGYASYGSNVALCGEAKKLADKMYSAATKYFKET